MKQNPIDFGGMRYTPGRAYSYQDLPDTAKHDALISASGEGDVEDFDYLLVLIPAKKAERRMSSLWKKRGLDPRTKDYVERLARDIEERGLVSPPTGTEGFHRALALVSLDSEVPYFRMVNRKSGNVLPKSIFP